MTISSFLVQLWEERQAKMLDFNIIASLILVLTGLLFLKSKLTFKNGKLRLPPSPAGLPILGNLHQLGTLPHHACQALSKKYGPVILLHLGHKPTVVVSSVQAVKDMMKVHDVIFSNRPHTGAAKIFFYGPKDLAFAPYGEYWRQIRRICVLELLSLKRVHSFAPVREQEVSIILDKIHEGCIKGVEVNVTQLLLSLANNIACRCILGRKYEEENGKNRFAQLTTKLAKHFMEFSFQDLFPSVGWMDVCTGLIARFNRTSREMDAFLEQAIEEHKNQLHGDSGESEKNDFLHVLLQLQGDGSFDFRLTNDHIKMILLDMIVGGTDTVFTTLGWAIAELIKHPDKMKKVQEEVRRVVGKKSKVDENDLSEMEYLKCVVKEALRLHPPAPLLIPREPSACVRVLDYDIPAKTQVFINVWAIQRDPEIWERAKEFLPERFLSNPVDFRGQDFNYLPFGGGRRGCPGVTFGTLTLEYVLANLLYWFNWKLPGNADMEELDMSEAHGMTVHRKLPLLLVPVSYSP